MRKNAAQKRKKRSLYVKRRNKRVKSALLVAGSSLLLATFFLVKSLITPAVSAFSSKSNNLKDKDIYSVLLTEQATDNTIKTINLLLIQRTDNKLYSINIPTYTKMDLPGRLGEEELSKVAEIDLSVNGQGDGTQLLVESVKNLLKINVDRYIVSDTEVFDRVQGAVFHKELSMFLPWQLKSISGHIKTNLNSSEIYDFVDFSRKLDTRDVISLDLSDMADLNLKIRDITLSGAVARESQGVVILNGTGVGNIAKEVSTVAQNMGSRISVVSNAQNEYQKSYLITDEPLSPTVIYLKNFYPQLNIINKSASESLGEDMLDRGSVSVIVGFDILDQLQ